MQNPIQRVCAHPSVGPTMRADPTMKRTARFALLMLAWFAGVSAYSLDDPGADHAAVAIEYAETGDMTRAVASFRAAAFFAPGVAAHWFNLGTALEDEDFDQKTAATAVEAKKSFRRHAALEGAASADSTGNGEDDGLQGGGAIPGRGWGLDWSIDISDKHKRYFRWYQSAQAGDVKQRCNIFRRKECKPRRNIRKLWHLAGRLRYPTARRRQREGGGL